MCVDTSAFFQTAVYVCVYVRRPQSGEGIYLFLRVLAELAGDFSGLRQLLGQVGADVVWQLLVARRGRIWEIFL